jgi:ribosomal protein S18 acetylase RimI-like enzyme
MPVKIRPMTADDKPLVMDILRHTPEFKRHEVAVAEEVIDTYLRDSKKSGYHIIVAEGNPEIDGYICYGPTPCTEGTWDIYWEAVKRGKRGGGIGTALIKTAETAVRKERGRLLIVETSSTPAYENTRLFYTSRGYRIISRIPDFYAPGDDKIIMHKRLRENK